MVPRSWLDANVVIGLLIKKAAAFATYGCCRILGSNLKSLYDQGLKEIAAAARIEDQHHFAQIGLRIFKLGAKLPESMTPFYHISGCLPASLSKDPTDIKAIRTLLAETEPCA